MNAAADDPNKTYTMAELQAAGLAVYTANCAVCHQASGKGAGAFPALDGDAIVQGPLADHINIVLHGKQEAGKPAMPNWDKALNDVEIAAVVTYERNAWGNHTGEVVQPKQVAAARDGSKT
ncbi:MAG: cytochrome c [Pararobbsia sp.]